MKLSFAHQMQRALLVNFLWPIVVSVMKDLRAMEFNVKLSRALKECSQISLFPVSILCFIAIC